MIRAGLTALALCLAACAPTSEAPMEEPPAVTEPASDPAPQPANAEEATAQDTCGAAAFAHLIGTPAADLDAAALPPGTRIITPDSMVTQDFRADRLNIITGTDGRVGSMRCF